MANRVNERRCPTCGKDTLHEGTSSIERVVASRRYAGDAQALVCASCDEALVSGRDLAAFERAVAGHLAEHGPASGEAFRFMRKALAMRAIDLAPLLGVSPETISRWETGERPVDRSGWIVLGRLVLDELAGTDVTRRQIASLERPSKARRVSLVWSTAQSE